MSNRQKAERLGTQPYITVTLLDKPKNDKPYYIAYSPEVEHCIGTGATAAEARDDLVTARIDLFESMLDDGLTIPEPRINVFFEDGTWTIDLGNPWKKARPKVVIGEDARK